MAGLVVVAEKVKDPGSRKGLLFGAQKQPGDSSASRCHAGTAPAPSTAAMPGSYHIGFDALLFPLTLGPGKTGWG